MPPWLTNRSALSIFYWDRCWPLTALTIPAVLGIGFITGTTIILGLDTVDTILSAVTFLISMLTCTIRRTNVLLGAVHPLLFLAYLMLIFEKVIGSGQIPSPHFRIL